MLPEIVLLSGGAVAQMNEILAGLEVDARRMRANIEAQQGLLMAEAASMALAAKLGKKQAHALIARASKNSLAQSIHLRQAIEADPDIAGHFDRRTLNRLFDPAANLGAAEAMIATALKK